MAITKTMKQKTDNCSPSHAGPKDMECQIQTEDGNLQMNRMERNTEEKMPCTERQMSRNMTSERCKLYPNAHGGKKS